MQKNDILEKLQKILGDLVAIPSVMGEPTEGAPFGIECKKALDYTLNFGAEQGFVAKNVDGYAGHLEFGEGEEIVGALCHLDVVPTGAGWDSDPYSLTQRGGVLYGRGVVDNKASAAACLVALAELKREGFMPNKRFRLIFGCNEENGSECIKYYKTKEAMPHYAFVPDAEFPLINSEKGILRLQINVPFSAAARANISAFSGGMRINVVPEAAQVVLKKNAPLQTALLKEAERNKDVFKTICENGIYTVTAKGKAAHAMEPEKGQNAVSLLFGLLAKVLSGSEPSQSKAKKEDGLYALASLFERENLARAFCVDIYDEVSGGQTINLGLVSTEKNSFKLSLDCRCPLTQNTDRMLEKIEKALPPHSEVEKLMYVPNLYVKEASPLVQKLLAVYSRHVEGDAKPLYTGGGTYARELDNAVAFGPSFENQPTKIHDANENISLDHLYLIYKIYKDAIVELCK